MIAIDGSKLSANASQELSYDYERIAREILARRQSALIARATSCTATRGAANELPEHVGTRRRDGVPHWRRHGSGLSASSLMAAARTVRRTTQILARPIWRSSLTRSRSWPLSERPAGVVLRSAPAARAPARDRSDADAPSLARGSGCWRPSVACRRTSRWPACGGMSAMRSSGRPGG